MAETMNNDKFSISAIAEHLRKGAFAPIFEQSNEKDDHVALKLMCIVDYNVQRWDLYRRIQAAGPKLLAQLMQFRSYGTFKDYDYHVGHEIGKRVLQCKWCKLIGPYGCILTHMAINHDTHIGLKVCAYCNGTDLKKHFEDDSLPECYGNYLQRNDIVCDENVYSIVSEFYDMLKGLAEKFKIKTIRNYGFAGKGHAANERLDRNYGGDIDENVMVTKVRTPNIKSKNISGHLDALDQEFRRVMSNLYGGNNASRLMQQSTNLNGNSNGDTIVISDDDDDDEDGRSRAKIPRRSFKLEAAATTSTTSAGGFTIRLQNDPLMSPIIPKSEPPFNGIQMVSIPSTSHSSIEQAPVQCAVKNQTDAVTLAATSNSNLSMEETKNDVEWFGRYVMQRLYRHTNDLDRRKLESAIQEAIAKTEKEFLQKN